ncbi:MAG: radical SAM protein [Candidatus Izimaplasma sp.]|nr:radical SAM protein [Candidatus Izimaplasma bacterium]
MRYRSLRSEIIQTATKKNIPVLGEFELTAHCNLKCKMCYVVDSKAADLSTEKWKKIFKDAVDAGLLYGLLTGGEIFVRKDFTSLYTYLYDLGVRITLFSNGTVISDDIIETLKKRPPEQIMITLYGASDETYEVLTSDGLGFTKVKQNIKKLKAANINIALRTIPLKPIFNDIDDIIEFVKAQKTNLYYTQYIGPTREGTFSHKDLRLDPHDLLVFSDKIDKAFDYETKQINSTNTDKAICAALRSAYFINYKGFMQPCAMAYKPVKNVINKPFLKVFRSLAQTFQNIKFYDKCISCALREDCIQCYARRLLEKESSHCPPYLKALALNKKAMKS